MIEFAAKEWDALEELLLVFTRLQLTKKSIVIALGGGSVSDSVGLACSLYKRGVPHINMPTTLLSQVDASIGGKTAVNFGGFKNLLGAFYEPIAVFIIRDFLKSLHANQLMDGLAEIIKAGFIKDPVILDILEAYGMGALTNPIILDTLILRAIAVKLHFVDRDPKDKGVRQALNLGHTIGHALELKYRLSHGESVLLGMMKEFQIAEMLGTDNLDVRGRLESLLGRLGIGLKLKRFVVDERYILQDKKLSGKEIDLPIVERAGRVRLIKIRSDRLMAAIKKCNQKQPE